VIDFDATGNSSFRKEEGEASPAMPREMDVIRDRRAVGRGFLIVSLIAALFLGYGIFTYFAIGDKGNPDWDFGSVEDTPGQSVYSTGEPGATEPQHVSRKPSGAAFPAGKERQ
jgi:hypothetical protein